MNIKITSTLSYLTFALIGLLISSCASTYKPIDPQSLAYSSTSTTDSVTLSYKYNLITKRKYVKKQRKNGVQVVAVKIQNNSTRDLTFGRDFHLVTSNGNTLNIVDNQTTYDIVKQKPGYYLLYLLLTPMQLYTSETQYDDGTVETNSFPIGLILGPGLTAGNLLVASSANKKFENELETYNLRGKILKAGETVHGLIGVKTDSFEAINIKLD